MIPLLDLHADSLTAAYDRGVCLVDGPLQLTLSSLTQPGLSCLAIYLADEHLHQPFFQAQQYLRFLRDTLASPSCPAKQVFTYQDLQTNWAKKIASVIVTVEGGELLEGDIAHLEDLYQAGVRMMSLTWNRKNELGCGAPFPEGGLTELGRQTVRRMEQLGMVVDVSHLNDKGFWEVASIATRPFVASHSNCRTVTPNRRNLTDRQLKAIADSGGVVGLNLYPPFLTSRPWATSEDALAHLRHMLKVIGEDHIAFGCDFDGIEKTPQDLPDFSSLQRLEEKMVHAFGTKTTEKICFSNGLRVFRQVWKKE